MSRWPRSATVIVEHDCYILEMARAERVSVSPAAIRSRRKNGRRDYRQRMLPIFLSQLSLFTDVDESLNKPLIASAELETYDAGDGDGARRRARRGRTSVQRSWPRSFKTGGGKLQAGTAAENWESLQLELGGVRADDSLVGMASKAARATPFIRLCPMCWAMAPTRTENRPHSRQAAAQRLRLPAGSAEAVWQAHARRRGRGDLSRARSVGVELSRVK